jgi:two-component system response regulator
LVLLFTIIEMAKVEVLLIDDSPEDRELASHMLRKLNFIDKILTFKEGEEAIDFLFSETVPPEYPRFIFLDLNMPKMGGLEFIHKIKSNEKTREIPIAVLTSTTELPDIKESMKLGVKYYIPKPIEVEDVEKIAEELGYTADGQQ